MPSGRAAWPPRRSARGRPTARWSLTRASTSCGGRFPTPSSRRPSCRSARSALTTCSARSIAFSSATRRSRSRSWRPSRPRTGRKRCSTRAPRRSTARCTCSCAGSRRFSLAARPRPSRPTPCRTWPACPTCTAAWSSCSSSWRRCCASLTSCAPRTRKCRAAWPRLWRRRRTSRA